MSSTPPTSPAATIFVYRLVERPRGAWRIDSERLRRALDVLADALQDALEPAGLLLALENLQRAEQRQTRVLKRGELARERGQVLGGHAADGEATLLLLLGLLGSSPGVGSAPSWPSARAPRWGRTPGS